MMDDWKDILSDEDEKMSDEELMKYLEGSLSEEEKETFEKRAVESEFVSDAVEGLKQFKNKQKLDEYVQQLKKDLHRNLSSRKQRMEKRRFKDNRWVLLAVLMILAICIIVYIVVRMYHKESNSTSSNTKPVTVVKEG